MAAISATDSTDVLRRVCERLVDRVRRRKGSEQGLRAAHAVAGALVLPDVGELFRDNVVHVELVELGRVRRLVAHAGIQAVIRHAGSMDQDETHR